MMQLKKYFCLSLLGLALACTPKIESEEFSLGEVDPTSYVAIGGANTAGYSDDALHFRGQQNSFVSIIATQLNQVQNIPFSSPLLSEFSSGINLNGDSRLILGYKTDCNNETSLSPVRFSASGDGNALTNVFSDGPFNNIGVPFMKAIDVNTAGYSNPFYARIASNPASSSILQDVQALNPTFFTIQLGEHDLMEYALSGGTASTPTPVNGASGVGFDGSLNEVVQTITSSGAKGAISNIPDILNYPYFTTVPYNGLTLDAANAQSLNNVFNPLGISFQEGENAFTVEDPNEPFGVRKLVEGELILLSIPLDSVKCNGMGSIVPIPHEYVLTLDEVNIINNARTGYNSAILNTAQQYNLAFVDASTFYNSLNTGIVYNGVSLDAEFVTGGFFSLDGRNLNPIGHALLANEFIKATNDKYNSRIPLANATSYPGVIFP